MRLLTSGPFEGLPAGYFGCLLFDPPWRDEGWTADPGTKAPPYPTMPIAEIRALPVADLCRRDCWLFLWTSGPFLEQSLATMRAWGFRYSSVAFTWVKLQRQGAGWHRGLGRTTRKNTETVLLGKIGSPPILALPDELVVTFGDVLVSPVREHSRKPDEIRDRIARMVRGPRLEGFARQRAPGWHAWGNERDKWAPILAHDEESDRARA